MPLSVPSLALYPAVSAQSTVRPSAGANGLTVLSADGLTTRLIVQESTGRVGIGTAAPGAALATPGSILVDSAAGRYLWGADASNPHLSIGWVDQNTSSFVKAAGGDNKSLELGASWAGGSSGMVGIKTNDLTRLVIAKTGEIGIGFGVAGGTPLPAALLHVALTDAGTNTATVVQIIGHDSSGTPAAGFGAILRFQLQSDTTADRDALGFQAVWATATDASRKARGIINVFDTAAREALRVEASGTAAMIGFLGAGASARYSSTGDLRQLLIDFGLLTSGGASPLNLNGGGITAGTGTFSGLIDCSGTVRVSNLVHPSTGAGIEFGYTGGVGYIQALSYPGPAVQPLNFYCSTWTVRDLTGVAINVTNNGAAPAIGFLGAASQLRQVSAGDLTNNVTSGGTTDTIANYTDLTLYANDAAAIRNNIYQLARKLKQVNDALRIYGLLT